MNLRALGAFLIALSLVSSCDRSAETNADGSPAPVAQTAPEATVEPEETPAELPPSKVPAEDVRALVDQWLEAQNTSDFALYESLYAPKFEGIKRVGPKTTSYDRASWLEDRRRMFGKKVAVEATELTIAVTGRSAVATFTQTWSSGSFKDVGPKQLVIVPGAKRAVIAREEMLTSNVVGTDDVQPPDYEPGRLAHVIDGSIVLSLDATGLQHAAPQIVDRSGEAVAPITNPPEPLKKWLGTTFVISTGTAAQPTCTATIESLHILARAVPHFGQVGYWNGEYDDAPKLSDAQVAQEIWTLAGEAGRLVIGRVDTRCEGGRWAHAKNGEAPRRLESSPPQGALEDRLVDAFEALPGHATIQKDYETYDDTGKSWSHDAIQATIFRADDATYALLTARSGSGCGGFGGQFWAAWQIKEDAPLVLLSDPNTPGELIASDAAVMLGDELVFITTLGHVRRVGTVWRRIHDTEVPFFDCPC